MRELAPGWTLSRVGDLFDMQIGKKLNKEASAGPEQREYITNKDVQWNRIHFKKLNRMSFNAAERERFRLVPGDLLVTEGGEVGRTAIWEGQREECYFQMSLHRLRSRGAIEPRYMLHYMAYAARFDLFVNGVSQTSIAHLPQDKFGEQLVAHPVDLAEQRRIVDAIDGAAELERGIEESITKLVSVREGLANRVAATLLSGPMGRVVDNFDFGAGITIGPDRRPQNETRAYLRVANVQRGRLDLSDVAHVEEFPGDSARYALRVGDLLVVEGHANPHEIGRCALVSEEAAGYFHQNHLFRLRSERHLSRFSDFWLNSEPVRAYWRRVAATSSGLYTISRVALESVPFPLVSRKTQEEALAELVSLERQVSIEERELAKLRHLKQGLVDDLLTGRVEVSAVAA
ncbi:restriction endonuclease subunit S [Streptomyces sp. NPDC008137]|uniref:restriction endonuclease subunit S n=1 Tax=Streptomyces sp. NPDC008137 TaxID=3364813 RepID=UPI0036E7EA5D